MTISTGQRRSRPVPTDPPARRRWAEDPDFDDAFSIDDATRQLIREFARQRREGDLRG